MTSTGFKSWGIPRFKSQLKISNSTYARWIQGVKERLPYPNHFKLKRMISGTAAQDQKVKKTEQNSPIPCS